MGAAMARTLIDAGVELLVWNRSKRPVEALVAAGATAAADVAQAFEADIVISVLSDDQVVRDLTLNSDVLTRARPGLVHVNMATVSVELAREAASAHSEHGLRYVAAPVFGRVTVAEAGELAILAAGDRETLDEVQPYFDLMGRRTWRLGAEPSTANLVKIIGNYMILTTIQSLGEALSLGDRAGLDSEELVELLTGTLFPGPVHSSYGNIIASRAYEPAGFSTVLGRKDLGLAVGAAADLGIDLPFARTLRDAFDEALSRGWGERDWSSVAEVQRGSTETDQ